MNSQLNHPVILYDGLCRLCNRMVRFVVRRDGAGVFRFASLQGPFAERTLARYGASPSDLDTFYVVTTQNAGVGDGADERLLARSDAVLFVLRKIGGIWSAMAGAIALLPRVIRDWAYRLVARNRYRVFGRFDACPVPDPAARDRFLDS